MEKAQSKDGTAIAFDQSGEGAPIVVVGGAARDRVAEAPLRELLASRFTVIAYDRRGRGDSGDTPPYAVEREIEDLEAVIGEAGGLAGVYGSSSGANLAVMAAARGLGITKLALHEPNFLVDDSRPPLPDDYVEQLDELVAAGRRGDVVELFMTGTAGIPAEFIAPMRDEPMWPGLEAIAPTLAYDGAVVAGFELPTERLAAIAVPTLVIDGGESEEWLRAGAQAAAEALPDAQRHTLDGEPHNVSPDAVAPVLEEFFAGEAP